MYMMCSDTDHGGVEEILQAKRALLWITGLLMGNEMYFVLIDSCTNLHIKL